jgi:hypothetical protein
MLPMSEDQEQLPLAATRNELDEVARTIAAQLNETEDEPLRLLRKVVKRLGTEQSLTFLQETLEVEAQGGLRLADGSRRRTPGGVFFYLVRTKGPAHVRPLFFQRKLAQASQDGAAASQTQPLPFTWIDRIAVLQEIGAEKGQATTVKITLIGRSGKVIDRGICVVTTMQSSKVPSLPKGLPTPQNVSTTYTVYIASKQWRRVEEALKDQEDVLIVEGFPQIDTQTSSIAVFATNTTTKKLQMAQRQAQTHE